MGIRLDQIAGALVPELAGPVSGGAAPRSSVSLPAASAPAPAPAAPVPTVNVGSSALPAQTEAVVEEVNQALRALQTDLSIQFDSDTGRSQVIVSSADGEVLRILPPDEVLDALGKVQAIIGLLLDETG